MRLDDDAFWRQRRNLLLAICVLWLVSFAGASTSSITAAGVTLRVDRPQALFLAIWLVFTYFLYRYTVYYLRNHADIWTEVEARWHAAGYRFLVRRTKKLWPDRQAVDFRPTPVDIATCGGALAFQVVGSDGRPANVTLPLSWPMLTGAGVGAREVLRFVLLDSMSSDFFWPFLAAGSVLVYSGFVADWDGTFVGLLSASRAAGLCA